MLKSEGFCYNESSRFYHPMSRMFEKKFAHFSVYRSVNERSDDTYVGRDDFLFSGINLISLNLIFWSFTFVFF